MSLTWANGCDYNLGKNVLLQYQLSTPDVGLIWRCPDSYRAACVAAVDYIQGTLLCRQGLQNL